MRLLELASVWLGSNLKKLLVERAFLSDSAETKATGRPENLQPASAILTQNWVS